MKRNYPALWTGLVFMISGFPEAGAGVDTGPKVTVHVTEVAGKAPFVCIPDSLGPCSQYVPQGSLCQESFIYLVVAQADTPMFVGGIGGVSLGIEYDGDHGQGVDILQWTPCVAAEYSSTGPRGEWPESGSGNRMVWFTCQSSRLGDDGMHAIAGVFNVYAYSDDLLKVTPNRNLAGGPRLDLANCFGHEIGLIDSLRALGAAGFGTRAVYGCNPCGDCPVFAARSTTPRSVSTCSQTPAQSTTWGRIKNRY